MKNLFTYLLSLSSTVCLLFLFAGIGFCEGNNPSFTNDDIDNYRNPSAGSDASSIRRR